jgi:hypothetical protein
MGGQVFMRKPSLLIAAALLAILTACSGTPTATTTAKKEPEKLVSVTGQSALYRMYQMARAWSSDAQVLKLVSLHLTEAPDGPPGAAPAWQAIFTSDSKGRSRGYTFSIVESEGNLHKGPFAGPEQSWSGPTGVTTPFLILAVKVDTDAAYKTAMTTPQSKAAEYDKKNPGKPITLMLEKNNKFPDPAWRVIWGESIGTSNFSVFVDASTGSYLETMR